jgi:uncharacterized protein HemX
MDEINNRRMPLNQRGNIDGVRARRPDTASQPNDEAPKNPDNPQPQNPEPPKAPQAKKEPNKKPKPKKRSNLLIIILAIIVLIGLSSLAVYAGLQKNSKASDEQQPGQASAEQDNPTVDNGELINQTINEIDQLDNQSDSSGEGLSDEKLGL